MVQVPAATPVTVLPAIEQVLVVLVAKVTGRPEVAVALAVVVPPTVNVVGVKVMTPIVWAAWLAWLTAMLWLTGAAVL